MKNISLVILFSILTNISFSQDIKTLFKRDTTKAFHMGGYGEPLAGGTQINQDWGGMIGIKGGVTFNRHFTIGPIAKVYVGFWEFKGNNLNYNDSANLELYMGSIGLFMEYSIKMESPIHITIPLNIMVGGVQINEDTSVDNSFNGGNKGNSSKYDVESSGLVLIEPGVNIDFNVAKFFVPSISVGYRLATGSRLFNVTDQDLSGIYFGLGLKFGKF